jgi:hypothetical protein
MNISIRTHVPWNNWVDGVPPVVLDGVQVRVAYPTVQYLVRVAYPTVQYLYSNIVISSVPAKYTDSTK